MNKKLSAAAAKKSAAKKPVTKKPVAKKPVAGEPVAEKEIAQDLGFADNGSPFVRSQIDLVDKLANFDYSKDNSAMTDDEKFTKMILDSVGDLDSDLVPLVQRCEPAETFSFVQEIAEEPAEAPAPEIKSVEVEEEENDSGFEMM